MRTSPPHESPVVFDLDGTLADSAPGIVASLEYALAVCGVDAAPIDWRRLIGPPLPCMLAAALPSLGQERRDEIVVAYRKHYDLVGMFETKPFPGILPLVAGIAKRGNRIYVLTNKPQAPADAILDHLQLAGFLHRVVGGDPAGRVTKPDRAAALAAEEGLAGGVFIGDGIDDLLAAERIGSRFFLAGWGYGTAQSLAERPDAVVLADPADVLRAVEE